MSVSINPAVYHNGGHATLDPSSSGLHGGSAQWQPPLPSMAALPVDMSKTEPKPAYYKLQFGDDYTGFSYYVRTLGIVIGRKCEKPIQVPPPDITSPQVPARPPLDTDENGNDDVQAPERMVLQDGEGAETGNAAEMESLGEMDSRAMAELLGGNLFDAEIAEDVMESGPSPKAGSQVMTRIKTEESSVIIPESENAIESEGTPAVTVVSKEGANVSDLQPQLAPDADTDNVEVKPELGIGESSEAVHPAPTQTPPAPTEDAMPRHNSAAPESHYEHDYTPSDAEIIHAMLGPPPPAPPPPPPSKSSAPVDHVDVDLGPLKSVSRNHAKIEFRPDLGHFCLEIHGRNGAWVDDRYYVKGSAVPLYQGSVIQIATRIFSFILPPSPGGSPATPHVLDASFDSNSPLDDVPYPYNLPASQVGYQEFFGESMPGPGPATIAQQVPQPFNAFTAPDGQGLGSGMEYDWSQDKRKGRHHWTEEWSSEDSEDSWDSWDESDEVEERRNVRPRRRMEEGESELSSLEDESEEEEEEEEEEEDVVQEGKTAGQRVEEDEVMPDEGHSVKEESMPEDPAKPKKRGRPKSASVSNSQTVPIPAEETKVEDEPSTTAARIGKGPAKSGKLPAKSVKAVKALKAQLAKQKAASTDTDNAQEPSGNTEDQSEAKKGKKVKVEKTADISGTVSAVEDGTKEKPKAPPKKASTKKAKAAASQTAQTAPIAPAPQAVAATPVVRPPAPAQVAPPVAPPASVPIQPQITTLAAALAAAPPPPRPPPVAPTPAPVATAVRPPPVATLASQTAVRPAPPPVRPAVPVRPPAQAAIPPTPPRPAPIHAISAQESTAASSPTGTPEPQKPFYLTELIETPGRPGHIIVNVPIPPSGAGPRPPPGPLIGLDGETFIGPPPIKPTATFAIIIYSALANLPRGRGTLGEVCNWIAGEWEWFRLNVDTGWQNSIRHNLSLNKAFLKVPRIPEDDPESKGSVWIIDPKEGPLFEEKQRKEAQKSEGKTRTAEMRAVRERQKIDERVRMQKEGLIPPSPTPSAASPAPARPPPPARVPVNTVRPVARPPAAPPVPKGPVLPKGKVIVSFGNITPAMRSESLIQTLDSNGNPMPFVCTNTHLVLERTAFGHLTPDIIDKLQMLGAQVAVDVLLGWVTNKNKQQAAKAAQAKAASANTTAAAPARPPARPNGNAKQVRPPVRPAAVNGSSTASIPKATPAATAPAAVRPTAAPPAIAASVSPVNAPAAPAASTSSTATTASKPTPGGGTSISRAAMRKIVSLIASAAAGNKDVSRVGPHANALLEYIKVVGAGIDLHTAEIIWTTGVMPPSTKAALNGGKVNGGVKRVGVPAASTGQGVNRSPAMAKPALKPSPSPSLAPSPTPSAATNLAAISPVTALAAQTPTPVVPATPLPPAAVSPVAKITPSPAVTVDAPTSGVKRKLEEESAVVVGGVPPAVTVEAEAKRPKVEVGTG